MLLMAFAMQLFKKCVWVLLNLSFFEKINLINICLILMLQMFLSEILHKVFSILTSF